MEMLCFRINDQRFAISVSSVEKVIMAQAITLVPDSPAILKGIIDYHGEIIAVINLRFRLGIPDQPVRMNDRYIITTMPGRHLALIVDEIEGVIEDSGGTGNAVIESGFGLMVTSMLSDDKGIVLIYDLEKLITSKDVVEITGFAEKLENPQVKK
jgi:purine-binding chemotaxis protein CheW